MALHGLTARSMGGQLAQPGGRSEISWEGVCRENIMTLKLQQRKQPHIAEQ